MLSFTPGNNIERILAKYLINQAGVETYVPGEGIQSILRKILTNQVNGSGEGGGASPSDANPQPLGTAAPGTSDEFSRADHVHELPQSIARTGTTGLINDNTAFAVPLNGGAAAGARALFIVGNSSNNGSGILWARADGTQQAVSGFATTGLINVIAGNGTLSGTTGPDNSLNFRCQSNGNLWIENRTGASGLWTVYSLPI